MRRRRLTFASVFLLGFGLVFLAAGGALAFLAAGQARAEAARAERLTPLSAAAIDASQPGREALVEGRVSPRNRPRFQGFVAYLREEYRGTDDEGKETWVQDERHTPPLLLDLADGVVALAGEPYALDSPPRGWQEPGPLHWSGVAGGGTKRYRGFRAGDTAMAIGALVVGREGPELQAERLYGGTRADYIAGRRSTAAFLPWFGGLFALIGAVMAGLGAWVVVRR